jgi:hypothetical protein
MPADRREDATWPAALASVLPDTNRRVAENAGRTARRRSRVQHLKRRPQS